MTDFQVVGKNQNALFSLKLHRGEGMVLLAMNWKNGTPSNDFIGFAIEYKEPNGRKYFALKNRLGFLDKNDKVNPQSLTTLRSPIQKFRWVHFPSHADMVGAFTYRVSPVFMNSAEELSYGEPQIVAIGLGEETFSSELNVTFTRGFVSSQAFVDKFGGIEAIPKLIPKKADDGLTFTSTLLNSEVAYAWMGFEARKVILDLLDKAIADSTAKVKVVAYDLNQPEIVNRLAKLGNRLQIIIDDSDKHGESQSAESQAALMLAASAGVNNIKRQHMGNLQHNKIIVVDGQQIKEAVCGSTNFTWRGLYVQSNNAIILKGGDAIKPFLQTFEQYWLSNKASDFGISSSATWTDLGFQNINANVTFSPHASYNAVLNSIASDIQQNTKSSLFYSLAFLYQTTGGVRAAIEQITSDDSIFVYGISDRKTKGGGLDVQKPDGSLVPVRPEALTKNLPEPFKSEPTGLSGNVGNRMHHKFVVIDFDKPSARVYMGSYNFSIPADVNNGENLMIIRNRKVAVSYMVEALRIFDHYHFRVAQIEASKKKEKLALQKPPQTAQEKAWWSEYFKIPNKINDRQLFS